MPQTILAELRQSTASLHRELEDSIDILYQIQDVRRYRHLLELFHGFYNPMELLLAEAHEWKREGIDFEQRRKAPWIAQDLEALGLSQGEVWNLPSSEDLPVITDAATAYGCLYVLEGSTLGGRQISSMLNGSPVTSAARRFFQGYGEETGSMWTQFCHAVERFASSHDSAPIVQGASETFSSLLRWAGRQTVPA